MLPIPVPPVFPIKEATMVGMDIREDAKMTGITPAVLTFRGMKLLCPPTILRPCIFLEYCTGIFLVASFRTITRTIVTRITAMMITAASAPFATV